MRLADAPYDREHHWAARLRPEAGELPAGPLSVRLVAGLPALLVADEVYGLEALAGGDADAVHNLALQPRRALHELLELADGVVTVRSLSYAAAVGPTGWSIAVDDEGVEHLSRVGAPRSPADAAAWLTAQAVIDRDPPTIIVSSGRDDADSARAMTLWTQSFAVDVRVIDGVWRVYASSTSRRRPGGLSLIEQVEVVPDDYAKRMEDIELQAADRVLGASEYFGVWRDYARLELEQAIKRARQVGEARFDGYVVNEDGSFTFTLEATEAADRLADSLDRDVIELEAGPRPYSQLADDEEAPRPWLGGRAEVTGTSGRRWQVTLKPVVEPRHMPKTRGWLFGAERGAAVRSERREAALLLEEHPPRRATRLMLDGQSPPAIELRRPIDARRSAAAMEPFEGTPTEAQLVALDVALNTPDIAVIQGPPGTGKTRVVAAIRAVLGERDDGAGLGAKPTRILVSAEQHDAVENAIRARAASRLPPVKLGKRPGQLNDNSHLQEWAHDLRTGLEKRLAETSSIHVLELAAKAQDRLQAAKGGALSLAEIIESLTWLRKECHELLDEDHREAVRGLVARHREATLGDLNRSEAAALDRGARALRVTPETFEDDGPQTLEHAREILQRHSLLNGEDRILVDRVRSAGADPSPADLRRLGDLRERVLDAVAAALRSGRHHGLPEDVQRTIPRLIGEVDRRLRLVVSDQDIVLYRLVRQLEQDQGSVRASLERHTAVLAATCQQVLGHDMVRVQASDEPFETVIIDEAARANPLDLLIPLSLGRRRVVFVGDHRQLPQLLDDEVTDALTGASDQDERAARAADVLSRSFFERLFAELSRPDQPVRRVVTLDRQYRMHPELGSLVNEFFYEPHGETVHNGVDAADRDPSWTGLGSPLSWVDVDASGGAAERTGSGSLRRSAEAEAAVTLLERLLERDAAKTVGIITFYRSQVTAIWEIMRARDLAYEVDGSYSVSSSWTPAFGEAGTPRFRIGTVDAFQGREFDAVLLSTVRTGPRHGRGPAAFGFLEVENRLCVAMSRQRDALIAIGDREHFASEHARARVPALHAVATRGRVRAHG